MMFLYIINDMRIVLTTVKSASVTIEGKLYSQISTGYLLLVGFTHDDNEEIAAKMVDKLLSLRVFPDENGNTNLSLYDVDGEILSVSQFTLYANTKKGRRPSFVDAMRPDEATRLYDFFNRILKDRYQKVQTGVFGANMKVESINDGPFTIILDSEELFS